MSKLSVELNEDQRAFVEARRSACGFSTASEYLLELIKREQLELTEIGPEQPANLKPTPGDLDLHQSNDQARAVTRILAAAQAGIESGPPVLLTDKDWEKIWTDESLHQGGSQAAHHG